MKRISNFVLKRLTALCATIAVAAVLPCTTVTIPATYDVPRIGDICNGEIGWARDSEGCLRDERMVKSTLGLFLNPRGILDLDHYFGTLILQEHSIEEGRDVDGIKFPHRIAAARRGGGSIYEFEEVKHNVPLDDERFTMPESVIVVTDVFGGIDNDRVLPMLKCLPYKHGGMNIPPRDGRLLYNLITEKGYRRGLEIGTSNGYSTLWLGLAFRKTGGEVITLEIEEPSGREARENFRRAGLDDVIDARIVDAFAEIPRIEGVFDFIFIDAWKPDYIRFLELVRNRVSPGGAITAHNVLSHGSGMRMFLDAIESDPGLETKIYHTSESGVSISIVRE